MVYVHNIISTLMMKAKDIMSFAYNTIMLLIKLFRIGPVTGPRLAVLDRG